MNDQQIEGGEATNLLNDACQKIDTNSNTNASLMQPPM